MNREERLSQINEFLHSWNHLTASAIKAFHTGKKLVIGHPKNDEDSSAIYIKFPDDCACELNHKKVVEMVQEANKLRTAEPDQC